MERMVRVAVLVVSFFFGGMAAWGQAVVDGFVLDQVDFASQHTGNIPCSEYGHAGFAVKQVPGITQYVQVVAQLAGSNTAPAWIVRNLPAVASILTTNTPVNLSLMGVQRGTCVVGAKVNYVITVTDNLMTAAPAFAGSSPAFIGQRTQVAEGLQTDNAVLPGLPTAGDPPVIAALGYNAVGAGIISGLGDLNTQLISRPGMGNIAQNTNECAPGAITNSMHWLQSMGAIDLKGDTPQQTMTKLKSDVSWNAQTGSNPTNMVTGKLKFAQRAEHPLDLEIHYQADSLTSKLGDSVTSGTGTAKRDGADGPPTMEYIKREMEKGQDVELSLRWLVKDQNNNYHVTGGHAMAVSGVLTTPAGTGIFINDDETQDGKGTKLRTNRWEPAAKLRAANKDYLVLGGENLNLVDTVFSESPKPKYYGYIPLENPTGLAAFSVMPPIYTTPGRPALNIREAVTGTLNAVSGSPFAAGSQTVAVATAMGKFVYAVNYGSNNMSAYKIDQATGALTPITGSPFAVGGGPFSVVVDPTGRLIYVGNSSSNNISAFTIDPITGVLTPVAGSPFSTGSVVAGLAISPSGRLLFSVGNGGGVYVYTIDVPTGVLTPVVGSPFTAGTNPNSVAVEPTGRFVYVVNAAFGTTNGNISVFSIGATGALTQIPGSPFKPGTQPDFIAIDPLGKFAYVSNYVSANVSAFTIDATSGALTQVSGSPYPVPSGPFAVAIEPTGQIVYVTSQGTNPGSISAFNIDATSGALTPLAGSPFPGGAGPARLAFAAVQPDAGLLNPVPALTQLAPSGTAPGSSVTVVSVYGNNFIPGAVVRWNGASRYTIFESANQLNVAIPASDLASAGTANITVTNPGISGTSASLPFTISASLALPSVPGNGTLNDAGFTIGQAVSPGSIATSFGSVLSTGTSALTSPPSNTVLGSSMKMDGRTAPLFFVSPGQVAFQVPWELAGQQQSFATFSTAAGTSAPATVTLAPYAPGIFTMNAAGQGAVVVNATGELTAQPGVVPGIAARPAAKNEYIAIYCTGLGDVTNRPATGAPASLDPNALSYTTATPSITIGGAPATPVFSGLAPGYVGLYQIVVQVPVAAPSGNAVPMVVSIGGQSSNTVTIAVQ